jgi:hypothetical protein
MRTFNKKFSKYLFFSSIFLVIGLSLLLLFLIIGSFLSPYRQIITQKDNYTMYWLTKPNYLEILFRNMVSIVDDSKCAYKLDGWGNDNSFYYSYECGGSYSFYAGTSLKYFKISKLPSNLKNGNCTKKVEDYYVNPSENGVTYGVSTQTSFSPDCKYVAVQAARMWSSYDVFLIKTE